MPIYKVPCPDGTDPDCYGEVEVEIDESGLSPKKVAAYVKDNYVEIDSCAACGSEYTRDADGRIVD